MDQSGLAQLIKRKQQPRLAGLLKISRRRCSEQQRNDDHDEKWRAEEPGNDCRHLLILSFQR
jgi:hypothetical protein